MSSRFDQLNNKSNSKQTFSNVIPEKMPELKEEEMNINNTNYLNLVKKEEPLSSPDDMEWKFGNVFNCSSVNFREKPSLDAKILMEIPNGTEIQFTEFDENLDWVRVKTKEGKLGYCMFDYINAEN